MNPARAVSAEMAAVGRSQSHVAERAFRLVVQSNWRRPPFCSPTLRQRRSQLLPLSSWEACSREFQRLYCLGHYYFLSQPRFISIPCTTRWWLFSRWESDCFAPVRHPVLRRLCDWTDPPKSGIAAHLALYGALMAGLLVVAAVPSISTTFR